MKSVIEVLETAIEMEEQGKIYYRKAADEANNPMIAAVLEALADDEENHIQMINQYYMAVEHKEILPNLDLESQAKEDADARIQKILSGSVGEIEADSSYLSVYEHALDLEREGRDYYAESAERSSDPDVKKFFGFLANVEDIHCKMLELIAERFK